jgi:hypothetical protein
VKETQIQDTIHVDGTQNRRTEIRTETTQDDVKQDRNGQNIQGGVIDPKDRSRT